MTRLSKIFPVAITLFLIMSYLSPALASELVDIASYPPMEPGYPHYGAVSGRITTENVSQGLPGAYVAIVNASNLSQAFYESQADDGGYYQFQSVNNTMAGGSPQLSYRIYASLAGRGESISYPFGVEEKTATNVIVVIANGGRTSSGFEVQHIPMPDDIRLTALPDTLIAGGNVSAITAQVYLNGVPYQRSGITITFFSDNDTRAYLPAEKKGTTDASGRTTINLTSGNATGGVNVTGYSMIGISRNITGACSAHIVSPTRDIKVDMNRTEVSNATEELTNVTSGNSPATPGPVTTTATPAPDNSLLAGGNPAIYAVLAIAILAVAGLGIYVLAFRKK